MPHYWGNQIYLLNQTFAYFVMGGFIMPTRVNIDLVMLYGNTLKVYWLKKYGERIPI